MSCWVCYRSVDEHDEEELRSCLDAAEGKYLRERELKRGVMEATDPELPMRAMALGLDERCSDLLDQVREERAAQRTLEHLVVDLPPNMDKRERHGFLKGVAALRSQIRVTNRARKVPDGIVLMEAAYESLVEFGLELATTGRFETFTGAQLGALMGEVAERFLRVRPEDLVGREITLPGSAEKLGVSPATIEADRKKREAERAAETRDEVAPLPENLEGGTPWWKRISLKRG